MTVASTELDKHLNYPVALLTADEITLAGSGRGGNSTSSYLYTGQTLWSLSPDYFDSSGYAVVFYVYYTGYMYDHRVDGANGVRPAISLAPGTKITGTGDGSATNPYIVS